MNFDINFFNSKKDELVWEPVVEWVEGQGAYRHLVWKGFWVSGGQKSGVPFFFVYVNVESNKDEVSTSLFVNAMRSPIGKGQKLIERQVIGTKEKAATILPQAMLDKYKIDVAQSDNFKNAFGFGSTSPNSDTAGKSDFERIDQNKFVHHSWVAAIVNLYKVGFFSRVYKKKMFGYQTLEAIIDFKTGAAYSKKSVRGAIYPSLEKARTEFEARSENIKSNGFFSIPSWADKSTWDMQNMKVSDKITQEMESIEKNIESKLKEEVEQDLLDKSEKFFGAEEVNAQSNEKMTKKSQSEWYSGNVPDPKQIEKYVGTSGVDASQLKSVFIGVDDALSLVNRFDSSLLLSIGFMFNFSNQGAYGVYLPMLDDKIKREKIKDLLRQEGCKIEEKSDGSFYATSENKSSEEIQKEIDTTYAKLKNEGGHVIGVNASKILSASRADAQAMKSTNPEDINDIILLHIGATIVHEAIHAKGSTSEGPSEQAEAAFISWALPIINEKRQQRHVSMGKTDEFSPLIVTQNRRSSTKCWYKKAQNCFPTGAQFSLEMPNALSEFNKINYGLMFANINKGPIESMLQDARGIDESTRDFSTEKKNNIINQKNPAIKVDKEDFSSEIMLERDRNQFDGYKSIESLLEERRPKPIVLPKAASSMVGLRKIATLFGWFSNLDLPMRERVIPGTDSDEFLAFDWDEIRKLPRYNYDGVSYNYCEPKFQPELWDQMISERPTSFINPARRFAQTKDCDNARILSILELIKKKILLGKMLGTRIVCSHDLLPSIKKFFEKEEKIRIQQAEETGFNGYQKAIPLWICRFSVPAEKIDIAEKYLSDEKVEHKELFDYIVGNSNTFKKNVVETIINTSKNICNQYSIEGIFLVGGFPRNLVMKKPYSEIHDLDFSGTWPDQCVKFGGMLADALGVNKTETFHRTMTLSWEWMGVKCDFKGNFTPVEVRKMLRQEGLSTTPLNMDVYARDFTINMLVYDIRNGIIYDVCKQSVKDVENKIVRTYFKDVDEIIRQNPLIILRALKYVIRYDFLMDGDLRRSITENQKLLFESDVSNERIGMGFLELISENENQAIQTLKEYGLLEKCKEYINYANAN